MSLEDPDHSLGAVWVDYDGAHSSALVVADDSIVVPNPGPTILDLLAHAFLGFCGEVGRVELSDATHDAVHDYARRDFVDSLGAGDEGCPADLGLHGDLDVVGAAAVEAVYFVNDDVVDGLCGGVVEHLLQG